VDEMDEVDGVDSSYYGESFGYRPVESQLRDKSANSGTQPPKSTNKMMDTRPLEYPSRHSIAI